MIKKKKGNKRKIVKRKFIKRSKIEEKKDKIIEKLNPNRGDVVYSKTLNKIQSTPISTKEGTIPSLLDFPLTYKEAVFIAEFLKGKNEISAARKAKLIFPGMKKEEMEKIINETLNNPNVSKALQCSFQDQIHRTLVSSDRIITQIAKIAFSDPVEMFDENGAIKDMRDIPPAIRCCISEFTNTNIYEGRGEDRVVVGHLSKVKLHDSLKALQVILKDIRDKAKKIKGDTFNFTQYNFGNKSASIKEELQDLSDEELDVLLKLSGQGAEAKITKAKRLKERENIEDSADDIIELAKSKSLVDGTSLYGLDELKEIESCNLEG